MTGVKSKCKVEKWGTACVFEQNKKVDFVYCSVKLKFRKIRVTVSFESYRDRYRLMTVAPFIEWPFTVGYSINYKVMTFLSLYVYLCWNILFTLPVGYVCSECSALSLSLSLSLGLHNGTASPALISLFRKPHEVPGDSAMRWRGYRCISCLLWFFYSRCNESAAIK